MKLPGAGTPAVVLNFVSIVNLRRMDILHGRWAVSPGKCIMIVQFWCDRLKLFAR